MNLSKLPKSTQKGKKRVGRGYGSGKGGHTVGRGAKGLKARSKRPLTFDGTKVKKSFLKKLPLQRGKGRFKPLKPEPVVVNLKYLNLFTKGSEVNLKTLVKKGILLEKEAVRFGVKVLGDGDLKVALKVNVPCSKTAVKKIEKVGGKVIFKKTSPKVKTQVVKSKTPKASSEKVGAAKSKSAKTKTAKTSQRQKPAGKAK